jgi:hypothetical protein
MNANLAPQLTKPFLKIWHRWQQQRSLLPFLWAYIFLGLTGASILTNTWFLTVPLAFLALGFNALGLITTKALVFPHRAAARPLPWPRISRPNQ